MIFARAHSERRKTHEAFLDSLLLPVFLSTAFTYICALYVYYRVLQQDQGIYQSKVRDMISENKSRLIVNINDLRRRNEARAAK